MMLRSYGVLLCVMFRSTYVQGYTFRLAFASISKAAETRLPNRLTPLQTTRLVLGTRLCSTQDDSAMSKSRAPFRMPKNSADDSVSMKKGSLAWNELGLWTELVDCLRGELRLPSPTPVQQLVVPEILKEPFQHIAFLAATGSGKTLAYLTPLLQQLKQEEVFDSVDRRNKRPRLLILVPTRELAVQIRDVVKALCHHIKLSSCGVVGGEDYGKQRKQLDRPVDVVVATPGRLLKHWKDHNIFLGSLDHIVMDEMDTMLEQGFSKDLKQLLYPLLYNKQADQSVILGSDLKEKVPRIILTSATMTQSIQKILGDEDTSSVNAKRHHRKQDEHDRSSPAPIVLPKCRVIKAPGLHKTVPRLQQVFIDVGSTDKMSLIVDIVSKGGSGAAIAESKQDRSALTLVFCNTASACQAVQYALSEAHIETLAYHGELNSAVRAENLQQFREAGKDAVSSLPKVLICTDLAARGLDVPQVDHVVMFDFPLNALDYLHRSGRTARGVTADRKGNGRVTALVTKRDKVLANAIETAVLRGEPIDGLSSRKSDYFPGGRMNPSSKPKFTTSVPGYREFNRGASNRPRRAYKR